MKKYIGSCVIGVVMAAAGYPVYKDGFNLEGIIMIVGLCTLWNIICTYLEDCIKGGRGCK